MKRRFTLLAVLLSLFAFQSNAQLVLNIPDYDVQCDASFTAEIQVENFDDISGLQFSVNWNETHLQYTGHSLDFPGGLATAGTSQTDNGVLTVAWLGGGNESLPDGTVIVEIDFDVIGDAGNASQIDISSDPTPIEATSIEGTTVIVVPVDINPGDVTIGDDVDPTITCPADVIAMESPGQGGTVVNGIAPVSSNDNCGIDQIAFDLAGATAGSGSDDASGQFFNNGVTTVTYTATDFGDNDGTCDFTVTVQPALAGGDTISLFAENLIEECNSSFQLAITANGFTDVTEIDFSIEFDPAVLDFDAAVSNIPGGTTTIDDTGAETGFLGLSWSGPEATLPNGGLVWTIDFSSEIDAAGLLSNVDFGNSPVTIGAQDADGPMTVLTNNGSVDVQDNTAPDLTCPDDVTVMAAMGETSAVVNDIDPTASDNCELASVLYELTGVTVGSGSDDASGTAFNVGSTNVEYEAEDGVSNTSFCDFDVLVLPATVGGDTVALVVSNEVAECGTEATVEISVMNYNDIAGGQFSVNWNALDLGYVDAVASNVTGTAIGDGNTANGELTFSWFGAEDSLADGTVILSITYNVDGDPGTLVAVEITDDPLAIEVSDNDGPVPHVIEQGSVDIQDTEAPTITCPDDLTVNGGGGPVVVNDIAPTVDDNCGATVSYTLTGATVGVGDDDASGTAFNEGTTTVTYTATDGGSNSDVCAFTVTVLGSGSTDTVGLIVQSVTAECDTIVVVPIDVYDFNDVSGLQFSVNWDLDHLDYISSETFFPGGLVTINDSDADNGIFTMSWADTAGIFLADGYTIVELTFLVSGVPGDVAFVNITNNPVPIEASNVGGTLPVAVTQGQVMIDDDDPPVVECPADTLVVLEPLHVTGVVGGIAPTIDDDCGIDSVTYSISGATSGSGYDDASGTEFNGGTSTVTYTAYDIAGNSASCSFDVTLEITVTDTLQLFAGSDTVSCGDTFSVDITVGDFIGLGGLQFSVNWDPNIAGYTGVQLNFPGGLVNLNETQVDNGFFALSWADTVDSDLPDGFAVATIMFEALADPVACSPVDISDDPVIIEASSVDYLVIVPVEEHDGEICVIDEEPPVALCQDVTIEVDANGDASVTTGDIDAGSTDDCALDTVYLDIYDFTCADLGDNTVTLTAVDESGNSATCTATVTVEDNIAPEAECTDITVSLDGSSVTIDPSDVDGGSSDNCDDITLSLDDDTFDCDDVGDNTVTLTVTDDSGNTASCTADVTVVDDTAPDAVCQDVTVELDGNGEASITPDQVDGGSTDNCAVQSVTADPTMFDINDVGDNDVTVTVTDVNGNSSTCIAVVSVFITAPCEIQCPDDITVSNDPGVCEAFVTIPNPTTTGACASQNMVIAQNFDDCNPSAAPAGWTVDDTGNTGVIGSCGTLVPIAFMFNCTNGYTQGGPPAPPPGFDGCQAVIDDDNTGSAHDGIMCLISPVVDLSGLTGQRLAFDWQFNDLGLAEFRTEAWNGASWDVLFVQTTDASGAADLDLTTYTNSDFQVRFCHDDANGWQWGLAVDNIALTSTLPDPIVINDYNGTEDASDVYPVGTTTVTFTVFDINGDPVECSIDVTVEDTEGPTMNCPDDLTVNLDAGECGQVISYEVTAFDNCPPTAISLHQNASWPPTNFIGSFTCSFGNPDWLSYYRVFDIPATSSGTIDLTDLDLGIRNSDGTDFEINFYTLNGPISLANLVPVDLRTVNVGTIINPPAQIVNIPMDPPVVLPSGTQVVVEVRMFGAIFPDQGNVHAMDFIPMETAPTYVQGCDVTVPGVLPDITNLDAFSTLHSLCLRINLATAGVTITQIDNSGLTSGDEFPIGTTTQIWQAEDENGNVSSCEFTFTVLEWPFPIDELACNDLVYVSVDPESCEALIGADMLLEGGPYGCYDHYEVSITTQGGQAVPNPVPGNYIGSTLIVTVTDPETGNSCWGEIVIEDKFIPELECSEFEVNCDSDFAPGVYGLPAQQFHSEDEPGSFITVGSPVDIEIPVSLPGTFSQVTDIDLEIDISHTWVGDLSLTLTAPSGNSVTVFTQDACLNDDLVVSFDDDAANPYAAYAAMCNATPPARMGDFQPSQPFSNLNGEEANGTWILTVNDGAAGDDGTVNFYSLTINANAQAGLPLPLPDDVTVTPNPGPGVSGPYVVSGFDACGDVTLTYEDVYDDQECDSEYSSIVYRNWTAVDESGNVTNCADVISLRRATLGSITLPPNYDGITNDALSCGGSWDVGCDGIPGTGDEGEGDGYPQPCEVGEPGGTCDNIVGTYDDHIFEGGSICNGTSKILRKWTLYDWCTGEVANHDQLIKLLDDVAPVLECAGQITGYTNSYDCYGTVNVPAPDVFYDACSDDIHYTIEFPVGTIVTYDDGQGNYWYQINDVPAGNYTLTYVGVDGCGNESRCQSQVAVVDNVVPIPICDVNTNVSLGSDGQALIYAATFDDGSYDNCGIVDYKVRRKVRGDCHPSISNNDRIWKDAEEFCCEDIDNSPIVIELGVWDAAGNFNSCWVNVNVEDKLRPYIQAPPNVTISCDFPFDLWDLSVFGNVVVPQNGEVRETRTIDDPHYGPITITDGYAADNCGVTVTDIYNDDLECGQGRITRVFTATDDYQNTFTAVQFVFIVDHDPFEVCDNEPWCTIPGICTPPPDGIGLGVGHTLQDDVEWPCDIKLDDCNIDVASLAPEHLVESMMINDNTGQSVSRDAYPDWDDDNCSQIAVTYLDDVFDIVPDACMKILRHWKMIDWCQFDPDTGEGLWEYTQVIKVLDDEVPEFPDGCDDVTFCDTTAVGCTGWATLAPAVNECTPAEYLKWQYRIYTFEVNDEPNYCDNTVDVDVHYNEITNRITVIRFGNITSPVVPLSDVVRYSTNGGASFSTYFGPFTAPDDFADLLITRSVDYEDGCDSDLTIYGASGDASDYYPFGTHRIQWIVEDMCSNENSCDYDFTVEDCKKPTPVCINGLSSVVMPSNGCLELHASYFDAASFDNCTTNENLIFSYSSDIADSIAKFTCDDLGTNQVTIYVTDEYGNQDFCNTFITIEDNSDVCGDPSSTIAGLVETEMGEAVADVLVDVESPMNVQPQMTGGDGIFGFYDLEDFNDYEIIPGKDINHLNGVTTYDLALIQRHVVELEYLDTPYKLIAADANDDGSINVLDIIDLRKLILGLVDELPNNTSWRFVDAEQTFPDDMTEPPASYNESIMHENLLVDQMETDFIGVKIGDVNNSAEGNDAAGADSRSLNGALNFLINNTSYTIGDEVLVEVRAANFDKVLGYQFTFGFDINQLRFDNIIPGKLNVTDGNFGTHRADRGVISTSWNDVQSQSFAADEVLFTLVFRAQAEGTLNTALGVNSVITMAESYSDEKGVMDVSLAFEERTSGDVVAFALYQNTPNPFIEATWIGFNLPQKAEITMTIFDAAGKTVRLINGEYDKGFNQIQLNKADVGSSGVFYYQLQTEGYSATKKMIIE